MEKFQYTITDELGIHARPAGMLVRLCMSFKSSLTLTNQDGTTASLKRIFTVMGLSVKCGDTVIVTADGEDEKAALETVKQHFSAYL